MEHPLYYAFATWIVVTALLLWRAPLQRGWALRTSVVYLAALGGALYVEPGPVQQVLYGVEGLALIALTGRAIVDVIGPRFGVRAPGIMRDLLIVVASALFVLIQLRSAGVEITALITTSAVLSVTLGIALQDTLGNMLGGLSLQLDDSLNVGDWIRYDGQFGRVMSMSWRHVSFHTNGGETIVLPNSVLVKNKFVRLGRDLPSGTRGWRRVLTMTLDLHVPPSRAIETMERTLLECEIPHVLQEPRPSVVLASLEQGLARYEVRYWLDAFTHDDTTDSAVRSSLYFALRRADISLAAPATFIEYQQRSNRRLSALDSADLARAERLLSHIDIFKPLLPEEITELAQHIRVAPFAKGDNITKQGAEAHWLYIIADGEAEVVWQGGDGQRHVVAELGPGDFFGEMGLLTGEPRTATIVAKTDAVCWRIDKQAILTLIHSRPAITELLSYTLTKRKNELDALRARHSGATPQPKSQPDMLDRIKSFFNVR